MRVGQKNHKRQCCGDSSRVMTPEQKSRVSVMLHPHPPVASMALDALAVQNSVKTYYGETLSKSGDLKTNACCTGAAPPPKIREALRKVSDHQLPPAHTCAPVEHARTLAW